TTTVTVPEPGVSMMNRPSVPDTVTRSPSDVRATMEAPGTTAPDESLTTPETMLPARAANRERTAIIMGRDYTAPGAALSHRLRLPCLKLAGEERGFGSRPWSGCGGRRARLRPVRARGRVQSPACRPERR